MCRESKLRRQWDKARSFEANRASTRNPQTSEARRHAVTVTAPLPSVARWRLRAQSPAHHRMREQGRPRTRTHRATARARARKRGAGRTQCIREVVTVIASRAKLIRLGASKTCCSSSQNAHTHAAAAHAHKHARTSLGLVTRGRRRGRRHVRPTSHTCVRESSGHQRPPREAPSGKRRHAARATRRRRRRSLRSK